MSIGPNEASTSVVGNTRRSNARLACVQLLYQIEISDQPVEAAITEFLDHRMGQEIDGDFYAEPDRRHFEKIVRHATNHLDSLDTIVSKSLSESWTLTRLDAVMRALMRAATCELTTCPDVPARVVINEYVELATAFFSGSEPAFVNGALDSIARRIRREEMSNENANGRPVS